jgi:hypothetical protein
MKLLRGKKGAIYKIAWNESKYGTLRANIPNNDLFGHGDQICFIECDDCIKIYPAEKAKEFDESLE